MAQSITRRKEVGGVGAGAVQHVLRLGGSACGVQAVHLEQAAYLEQAYLDQAYLEQAVAGELELVGGQVQEAREQLDGLPGVHHRGRGRRGAEGREGGRGRMEHGCHKGSRGRDLQFEHPSLPSLSVSLIPPVFPLFSPLP